MASSLRSCCRVWRIPQRNMQRNMTSSPLHRRHRSLSTALLSAAQITSINSSIQHIKSFQTDTTPLRSRRATPSEHPQTDFNELNMLGAMPTPSTSVDVCMYDGFGLNSGITITGGKGALLVNGEAFSWTPWVAKGSLELANKRGQFELPREAFGLFDLLWPRPDLLVIGVGKHNMPLSPETRQHIAKLGMRVEVLDTRNAAAQFNLLATERGVWEVAAALIPLGWQEGVGATD